MLRKLGASLLVLACIAPIGAACHATRTGELEPLSQPQWQDVLLDWATWSDSRAPSVQLEALHAEGAG